MATDPFDLYPVIAQITAAFAGFGSLASGIGQTRGGDDARMDAYRLQNMLRASLSATLFGLLPATLIGLSDEAWGLRLAALVAVGGHIIFTPVAVAQARKLRHVTGFSIGASIANFSCTTVSMIAFGLCALDIPPGHAASVYLLGLMGLLASSGMLFSRVIVSMLRPLHNAKDS
jgi:hypothetical protein